MTPLRVALAVYACVAVAVQAVAFAFTRGELTFPLDDPYIHFSIARTLAEHGVYGLQPSAFSTPASSLVWPLLLAGPHAIGVRLEWLVLALGLATGAFALRTVDGVLLRAGASPRARLWFLVFVGALTPIVPMALLGMEHAPHIAVMLALVAASERADAIPDPFAWRGLALLAALGAALRYETAFVVAPLVLWLARRRDRRSLLDAAAIALGALVPVAIAAAFFALHGAPLVPASVALKRTPFIASEFVPLLLQRAREHVHVPALLFAAVLAPLTGGKSGPWLFVGVIALFLQASTAQLGWFFRYESYAVALVLVGLARAFVTAQPGARRTAIAVAAALSLAPLVQRAAFAHGALPKASRNIAEQQREIARFVRTLPSPSPVAVNDVGAIAWYGGKPVLDLIGLADLRVARARGFQIGGPLGREEIERLTQADGVQLAVVYRPWFEAALPKAWTALEQWSIKDNRVCAFDTVTFYAVDPAQEGDLRRRLEAYRETLPVRIKARPLERNPP